MATYVLVHGSFHGGWCWRRISSRLDEEGHATYTPALTGLGERSHLVSPRVGLDLHIEDVVQIFEYNDLDNVVLVGHSYGGMVVFGVAERCVDRIAHLAVLDGFRPEHGQSAWDISPNTQARWEAAAAESGNGWLTPPPDPETAYGIEGSDVAWVQDRLVPTPLRTHEEPLHAPNDWASGLPQTYISCTQYNGFEAEAQRANTGAVDYFELDTGHDAMVTAPEELSRILLAIPGPDG